MLGIFNVNHNGAEEQINCTSLDEDRKILFDHYITLTGAIVKYHQPLIEGIEIDCLNNNVASKLKVFIRNSSYILSVTRYVCCNIYAFCQ